MSYKEIRAIIQSDKENNQSPSNRFFIYCFRLGQWAYVNRKSNILCFVLSIFFRIVIKCTINVTNHYPLDATIGGGITLPHNIGIIVSGDAVIGNNCTIFHHVTIGANVSKEEGGAPKIGEDVFIGAGAKLIGNITVGDRVRIGANAVVTKDIPADCTVVGANQIIYNT